MSVKENVATFITKLPKLILLCVIIYLISLNFKTADETSKNQEVTSEVSDIVPLDAVKNIFQHVRALKK